MQTEFPKNPQHKQLHSDSTGGRYIYNDKTSKWYTFTDQDEKDLAQKENKSTFRYWVYGAVGALLWLMYLSNERSKLESTAKELGFSSYAEYEEAQKHGVLNPKDWVSKKIELTRAKEEALKKEYLALGFKDASTYKRAKEQGVNNYAEWQKFKQQEVIASIDLETSPLNTFLLEKVIKDNNGRVTIAKNLWRIDYQCVSPSTCLTSIASTLENLGKWVATREDIEAPSAGFVVNSYVKTLDKYGNENNSLAFKLHLKKQHIDKANWSNMNIFLTLDLTELTTLRYYYKKTAYDYCFEEDWAGKKAVILPSFCRQVSRKQ